MSIFTPTILRTTVARCHSAFPPWVSASNDCVTAKSWTCSNVKCLYLQHTKESKRAASLSSLFKSESIFSRLNAPRREQRMRISLMSFCSPSMHASVVVSGGYSSGAYIQYIHVHTRTCRYSAERTEKEGRKEGRKGSSTNNS